MKNYFEEIRQKLINEIEIEDIEIVDNSHKHKGHKFFSPEKLHLKLPILEILRKQKCHSKIKMLCK